MAKKILIILGIVFVVGVIGYVNKKRSKKLPLVNITIIQRRDIEEWVEGDGEIKPVKLINIGSDVTARITRIFYREGDNVKRGDVLCLLDDATFRAKVEETRAQLERDLYTYLNKKKEFERTEKLFKRGFVSKKSYEDAELALNTYKAILRQDSFLLEEAVRKLNKTVIKSPVSGIVLAVFREEGEMAVVGTINTPGSVIMTIAEMDSMEVKGYVDETGILKVKKGQPVLIKLDALPGKRLKGTVYRIVGMPESANQSNVVTYPVYVRIKDTVKLYPGMSASIKILVRKASNVPAVPVEATGRDKNGYYVWKIEGKRCIKTRIVKGVESLEYAEVKKGLSIGDTVITGPLSVLRNLKDSSLVKVKEADTYSSPGNGKANRAY